GDSQRCRDGSGSDPSVAAPCGRGRTRVDRVVRGRGRGQARCAVGWRGRRRPTAAGPGPTGRAHGPKITAVPGPDTGCETTPSATNAPTVGSSVGRSAPDHPQPWAKI